MMVEVLMTVVFGTLAFVVLMCETVLAAIGVVSNRNHHVEATDW